MLIVCQGVVWANPDVLSNHTLQVQTIFTRPGLEESINSILTGYLIFYLRGIEDDARNRNVTRIKNLVKSAVDELRDAEAIPDEFKETIPEKIEFQQHKASLVIDLGKYKIRYFNHNIPGSEILDIEEPGYHYEVIHTQIGKYLSRQLLVRRRLQPSSGVLSESEQPGSETKEEDRTGEADLLSAGLPGQETERLRTALDVEVIQPARGPAKITEVCTHCPTGMTDFPLQGNGGVLEEEDPNGSEDPYGENNADDLLKLSLEDKLSKIVLNETGYGAQILSVGVAAGFFETGSFESKLVKAGCDVTGVDSMKAALEAAELRGIKIIEAEANDAAFWEEIGKENRFDAVLFIGTLEHYDLERIFEMAAAVLRPGGRIYVLVDMERQVYPRDRYQMTVNAYMNDIRKALELEGFTLLETRFDTESGGIQFISAELPRPDVDLYMADVRTGKRELAYIGRVKEEDREALIKVDELAYVRHLVGVDFLKLCTVDPAGNEVIRGVVSSRKEVSEELGIPVLSITGLAVAGSEAARPEEVEFTSLRLVEAVIKESLKDDECRGAVEIIADEENLDFCRSLGRFGLGFGFEEVGKGRFLLAAPSARSFISKVDNYLDRLSWLMYLRKIGEDGARLYLEEDDYPSRQYRSAFSALNNLTAAIIKKCRKDPILNKVQKELCVELLQGTIEEALKRTEEIASLDYELDYDTLVNISKRMSALSGVNYYMTNLKTKYKAIFKDFAGEVPDKEIEEALNLAVSHSIVILHALVTYMQCIYLRFRKDGKRQRALNDIIGGMKDINSVEDIDEMFHICAAFLEKGLEGVRISTGDDVICDLDSLCSPLEEGLRGYLSEVILEEIGHGAQILSVGVETGIFEQEFVEAGCGVTGVSDSSKHLELAGRKGIETIKADADDVSFWRDIKEERFDAVIFVETVESFELDSIFTMARRVLRPGGRIYVLIQSDVKEAEEEELFVQNVREELGKQGFRTLRRTYSGEYVKTQLISAVLPAQYVIESRTGKRIEAYISRATQRDREELIRLDETVRIRYHAGADILKLCTLDPDGREVMRGAVSLERKDSSEFGIPIMNILDIPLFNITGLVTELGSRAERQVRRLRYVGLRLIQAVVMESLKDFECRGAVSIITDGVAVDFYRSLCRFDFEEVKRGVFILQPEKARSFIEKVDQYVEELSCYARLEHTVAEAAKLDLKEGDKPSWQLWSSFSALGNMAKDMPEKIRTEGGLNRIQEDLNIGIVRGMIGKALDEITRLKDHPEDFDYGALVRITQSVAPVNTMSYYREELREKYRALYKKQVEGVEDEKEIDRALSRVFPYSFSILALAGIYMQCAYLRSREYGNGRVALVDIESTLTNVSSQEDMDSMFSACLDMVEGSSAYMKLAAEYGFISRGEPEKAKHAWGRSEIIKNAGSVMPCLVQAMIDVSETAAAREEGEKVALLIDVGLSELSEKKIGSEIERLMRLLTSVKTKNDELGRFLGNLEIIKGEAGELLNKKGAVKPENLIVVTKSSNMECFQSVEGKAVIAAIDDEDFPRTAYLPLLEVILFAVGKHLGWDEEMLRTHYKNIPNAAPIESLKKSELEKLFSKDMRSMVIKLIPDAVAFDAEELVKIIERIRDILSKA